jgi:hemolysin activation/secretion protein
VRQALQAALEQGPPPQTLAEVETWTARLTAALRQGGFPVAQALMTQADWRAAQETGQVTFTVFPGRISRIAIENKSRVQTPRLQRLATQALCGVATLQAEDVCLMEQPRFERATQLLQDLPGVALDGAPRFGPGQGAGDVEAVFAIAEKGEPWSVDAGIDNSGQKATGTNRLSASLKANNLLGLGEDYAASAAVTTQRMWAGSLSGSVPILYDGLRLTAGLTRQQYSVAAASTSFAGTANTGSLGLTHPFARGLDFNLWGAVSYLHSQTGVNYKDYGFSTNGRIDALKLSLSANNGDRAQQLRTDLWSVTGALTLGHQGNDDALDSGPRRRGGYGKFGASAFARLGLSRSGDLFTTASLGVQLASRNLDYSEKLALGGPNAVRAYRTDEGSADAGVTLNLGLTQRLSITQGHQIQFGPIVDVAFARVNARPWANWRQSYPGVPDVKNNRTLAGYGAQLDWLTPYGFTVSASAAKAFGFSDGSWIEPGKQPVRYWLSLAWSH